MFFDFDFCSLKYSQILLIFLRILCPKGFVCSKSLPSANPAERKQKDF